MNCVLANFVLVIISIVLLEIQASDVSELVRDINTLQSDWTAEENELSKLDEYELRKLMGAKLKPPGAISYDFYNHNIQVPSNIPSSFDAREQWPKCASIASVKDQSNCGSCWAVSTASAMSDRLCIASNFKIHVNLSANALMTCCTACTVGDPGCDGGYLDEAWKYCKWHGLVTGGDYGSKEGCQPYKIKPCDSCSEEADTPACVKKKCTNKSYKKAYKKDIHKNKNYYAVPQNATLIQSDILAHGPLMTGFTVYSDFMVYKSGVYQHKKGTLLGNHAVRIIGWGVEVKKKKKIPYWLVANSWNRSWGENGFFKIRRGNNECDFEKNVYAGVPR